MSDVYIMLSEHTYIPYPIWINFFCCNAITFPNIQIFTPLYFLGTFLPTLSRTSICAIKKNLDTELPGNFPSRSDSTFQLTSGRVKSLANRSVIINKEHEILSILCARKSTTLKPRTSRLEPGTYSLNLLDASEWIKNLLQWPFS